MQRIWNYFLYSTWKLLNKLGDVLFQKPIYFILLNIFPRLRKNEKRGLKSYKQVMNDSDLSFNIAFSFGYMFFTTMIIYFLLFVYVYHLFHIAISDKLYPNFIAIVVLSYLTNEILSWRNDKYLKYFDEFDKISKKPMIYLSAILFHLGVITIAILTIHLTIGFDF
jgi:hypothetical protein